MPLVDVVVSAPIRDSFRVRQLAGMFDVPLAERARERFSVDVPGLDEPWTVGLIVGPSGSGKSTLARAAFGEQCAAPAPWPADAAIIDGFGDRPIHEITAVLSSVGFSSPPAWLRPYAVLSNGEKFRCDLARALLNEGPVAVVDEFTSVVDRTVAKVASAAVSRAVRRRAESGGAGNGGRFVAVTCHYDVAEWLEPDWVIDMARGTLARGRLRRPGVQLRVARAPVEAWTLFKRHHYLSAELGRGVSCFIGLIDDEPAAFCSVIFFPHPHRSAWREHRTVCLPDFQGIGIGNALSEFVASLYRATGRPFLSTTGHPAMIRHRAGSQNWRMTRAPGHGHAQRRGGRFSRASSAARLTASFEYIGRPRRREAIGFGLINESGTSAN
jgi:GNAT superfamily N-acetyltransferase